MEEVIDLIATDSSPAEISDKIKSLLFAKAAERIEVAKPYIASTMFDNEVESTEDQE
jgi:hypothetical protein